MKMTAEFALLAVAIATLVPSARADSALPWSAVNGGGGSSSSSRFAISGSIGQPTAVSSIDANHAVESGFWNQAPAPSEEIPALSIAKSGPNILIAWPRPATGYRLEWSPALGTPSLWTAVPFPYATSATCLSYSEPIANGSRCYRLRK